MARIAVLLSERTISFWEQIQIRKKADVKRVPDPSNLRPDNYWGQDLSENLALGCGILSNMNNN
jgi:hypothetical protein